MVRVKEPPTRIEISGPAPEVVLRVLREHFEVEVDCENDEELVTLETSSWYNDVASEKTQGRSLRVHRTNRRMTLQVLADKAGISKGNLSKMEQGKRPIGRRSTQKLAAAIECDHRNLL